MDKIFARTFFVSALVLALTLAMPLTASARSLYYRGAYLCGVDAWSFNRAVIFVENYSCTDVQARIARYYGGTIRYSYGPWARELSDISAYTGSYSGGGAAGRLSGKTSSWSTVS